MEAAGGKEVPEVKVEAAEEEKTNAEILDHDEGLSGEISATKERLEATEKEIVEAEKHIVQLTRVAMDAVTNTLAATRKWIAEHEEHIAMAERDVAEIEKKLVKPWTVIQRGKKRHKIVSIDSAITTLAETKEWVDRYEEYVENIKRNNDETEELIAMRPDATLPWEMNYQERMVRVYKTLTTSSLAPSEKKYNFDEFSEQVTRALEAIAVIKEQIAKKEKNRTAKTIGVKSEEDIAISRRDAEEIEEQTAKKMNRTTTIGQKGEEEIAMSRSTADEIEEQIVKKNTTATTTGQKSEEGIAMSWSAADEIEKQTTKSNVAVATTRQTSAECEEETVFCPGEYMMTYRKRRWGKEFEEQTAKTIDQRRVSYKDDDEDDASMTRTVEYEGKMNTTATKRKNG